MDQSLSKQCTRCGAAGAELYANDGALVCDTCFSYDQIVTGDLRASQEHLGMTPTGEVSGLVEGAEHTWHRAAAGAVFMALVSAALFYYAAGEELIIVAAIAAAAAALVAGGFAFRTMRFAQKEAPEVVRRSSMPPPMPGGGTGSYRPNPPA